MIKLTRMIPHRQIFMTFQPQINTNLENAYEYILLIIIKEHPFLPRLSSFCNWSAVSSFPPIYVWVKKVLDNEFMLTSPSTNIQSEIEKSLFLFFSFLYLFIFLFSFHLHICHGHWKAVKATEGMYVANHDSPFFSEKKWSNI